MSLRDSEQATHQYSSMERGPHSLHECRNAEEFCLRFEEATGSSVGPLGMGSSGSDVDLIVLVDSKTGLVNGGDHIANNAQQLEFSSESNLHLAGVFLTMHAGILVDLHVAITPAIHDIYSRLRRRGPELSETEIRTLGRLSTGWLLWQSEGYLHFEGFGAGGLLLHQALRGRSAREVQSDEGAQLPGSPTCAAARTIEYRGGLSCVLCE
jgi:hypothetical protein